jgi:hypothetical protein
MSVSVVIRLNGDLPDFLNQPVFQRESHIHIQFLLSNRTQALRIRRERCRPRSTWGNVRVPQEGESMN